jgi:hypothetical protein
MPTNGRQKQFNNLKVPGVYVRGDTPPGMTLLVVFSHCNIS